MGWLRRRAAVASVIVRVVSGVEQCWQTPPMDTSDATFERWPTADDVAAVVGTLPEPYGAVIGRLAEAGFTDVGADDIRRAIRDDGRVAELESGLVSVPALFDGVRFAIEVYDPSRYDDDVDEAEFAQREWLVVDNGAEPLSWWLVMHGPRAIGSDGRDLGSIETEGVWRGDREIDVFCAEDAWLSSALPPERNPEGGPEYVEVTPVGGAIRVGRLDALPTPTRRQIDAVRAAFEQAATTERLVSHVIDDSTDFEFAQISAVIEHAAIIDREAFVNYPSPRHEDLLAAAGFECRSRRTAREGFDWEMLDAWHRRNRLVSLQGFSEEQAEQMQILDGAALALARDEPDAFGPPDEQLEAAAVFASILESDVEVAEGFVESWLDRAGAIDDLLRFADAIVDSLGEATPGVGWLRAIALDMMDRPDEAVEELARHTSSHHEAALVAAASFAADRSDGVEAHRLLQRAGALDHLAAHDGEFVHDTPDLVLLAEAQVEDLAQVMAAPLGYAAFRSLRTSPIVSDLVRHEGGFFERFLAARRSLLPDDEVELADVWTTVDRSVFAVESTSSRSMNLRNLANDDTIEVSELAPSTLPDVGAIIVGRPLPVGDTHRAFTGFIEIGQGSVDAVLAALATGGLRDIAEAMGAAAADVSRERVDTF